MQKKPLLLVEDTASLRKLYSSVLERSGYEVLAVATLADARTAMAEAEPDVVLLDLMLPDGDGMALVSEAAGALPRCKVIVITANGSIHRAVEAMRAGAFDLLPKPVESQHLLNVVMNALSEARMDRAEPARPPLGFIGSSPAMHAVFKRVRKVAGSMAPVLVTGESGTGKQICAEAIHELSSRADGPFVTVNCASVSAEMLEPEIFGSDGAEPGLGAVLQAEGGTLFLDEFCDMDQRLQGLLLKLLQNSAFVPPGSNVARMTNTRVICATSRDPLTEVRAGRLRADLYYRLHVLPIHLPPLRERGGDVIEIAEALLEKICAREGRDVPRLAEDVRALFRDHPWPGNVRQLNNVLWSVVVNAPGPVITRAALPDGFAEAAEGLAPGRPVTPDEAVDALAGLTLAEVERRLIERTIALHEGSVPAAARQLGVSPSTIYRKLESWGRPASRRAL